MCGKSAYSWKTRPTRRSSGFREIPVAESNQTSASRAIRPDAGFARPATALSTDVLPAPDGPISATVPSTSSASSRTNERNGSAKRAESIVTSSPRLGLRDRGDCGPRPLPQAGALEREQDREADDHEQRADRERNIEAVLRLEGRVDGERKRLGDSLEAPREHDRRSELAEPAGQADRLAGDQPSARERHRDLEERA